MDHSCSALEGRYIEMGRSTMWVTRRRMGLRLIMVDSGVIAHDAYDQYGP